MFYFLIGILIALLVLPAAAARIFGVSASGKKRLLTVSTAAFFVVTMLCTVFMFTGAAAEDTAQAAADAAGLSNGLGYLAAALVTGLACVGAGIAVAAGASAAIGATSEDPKMFSKGLIFVALGEGIVLYGLLISFQILNLLG